jgi:hypothetical protein
VRQPSQGEVFSVADQLAKLPENQGKSQEELVQLAYQHLVDRDRAYLEAALRDHLVKSGALEELEAAQAATGDNNPDDALRRFYGVEKFLFQPDVELTPSELKFRNERLTDEYLPVLLKIRQKSGIWYQQYCAYIREKVMPGWNPLSKARAKREKATERKKLKKSLAQGSTAAGNKKSVRRNKEPRSAKKKWEEEPGARH